MKLNMKLNSVLSLATVLTFALAATPAWAESCEKSGDKWRTAKHVEFSLENTESISLNTRIRVIDSNGAVEDRRTDEVSAGETEVLGSKLPLRVGLWTYSVEVGPDLRAEQTTIGVSFRFETKVSDSGTKRAKYLEADIPPGLRCTRRHSDKQDKWIVELKI